MQGNARVGLGGCVRWWLRLLLFAALAVGCSASGRLARIDGRPFAAAPPQSKAVSFAILEDYDKGDDLEAVARDFQLARELGISELRCSFGWDDYEPSRGEYDFAWLKAFCRLALSHGIDLRPYIAYTPAWAGAPGTDDQEWNNPPADLNAWGAFVRRMVSELNEFPNILSYEFYNEENDRFWWDGTLPQYREMLRTAAAAVREAGSAVPVLMGGLVTPDADWFAALVDPREGVDFEVVAFHAYPETWSPPGVTVETYLEGGYRRRFVPLACGRPIWINEMGFATSPGRTEEQQANWFARAVSTFLLDPSVTHLGLYELRDSPAERPVLGENENYHLGLIRTDGRRKLAFDTVRLLVGLLNTGRLTPVEAKVIAHDPDPGTVYVRAFRRPDGSLVAFVYTLDRRVVADLRLPGTGRTATRFDLRGRAHPWPGFDGTTLVHVVLDPGEVCIFRIDP